MSKRKEYIKKIAAISGKSQRAIENKYKGKPLKSIQKAVGGYARNQKAEIKYKGKFINKQTEKFLGEAIKNTETKKGKSFSEKEIDKLVTTYFEAPEKLKLKTMEFQSSPLFNLDDVVEGLTKENPDMLIKIKFLGEKEFQTFTGKDLQAINDLLTSQVSAIYNAINDMINAKNKKGSPLPQISYEAQYLPDDPEAYTGLKIDLNTIVPHPFTAKQLIGYMRKNNLL